jgi:hypothetical protein
MPNSALQERSQQRKAGQDQQESLARVTVNLTSRSSRALELATQLTGDSKTDTINRALQVYAYLEQVTQNGAAIYVQESAGSEPRRLKIF